MSSRCSAAVFERYPAGGGEFALALALADNAHDDGTHIFPSVDHMAKKSRQSVRAVQVHLRHMVAIGWLQVVRQGGGRGMPAEYRISPAWLKGAELAPFSGAVDKSVKGAEVAPFEQEKGCRTKHERVQNDAQKGADLDTPYIEPEEPPVTNPPTPLGGAHGFDAIAAEYPRRARIERARRVYQDLAPDADLHAEIIRSIRAWSGSPEWQRENGKFVPKLGDYLRDKRWLDAPGVGREKAPSAQVVSLPPQPKLTPEQLAANAERARALATRAREMMGQKRMGLVAC